MNLDTWQALKNTRDDLKTIAFDLDDPDAGIELENLVDNLDRYMIRNRPR